MKKKKKIKKRIKKRNETLSRIKLNLYNKVAKGILEPLKTHNGTRLASPFLVGV